MSWRQLRVAAGIALASIPLAVTPGDLSAQRQSPGSSATRGGGSRVPCMAPLRWRVARVDAAFGLTEEAATARVLEAARWWESATGVELFRQDATGGFPIRFVYDERQERLGALLEAERRLARDAADLERRRTDMLSRQDRWTEARDALGRRSRAYEDRLARHNAEVEDWNERGGAPAEVAEALRARGEELDRERVAIEAEVDELQAAQVSMEAETRDFNRAAAEHTRRSNELTAAASGGAVQSGEYRESVRTTNGRVDSVSREIRVYRFANAADLRLVVAHELGHAIGLGHSSDADAVMAEEHRRDPGRPLPSAVGRDDLARLRAVCPTLFGLDAPRPGDSDRALQGPDGVEQEFDPRDGQEASRE